MKKDSTNKKASESLTFGNNVNIRGNLVTGEVHGDVSYENVETNIQQKGLTEQELTLVKQLIQPLKEEISKADLPANKKIMGQEYVEQIEKELIRADGVPDESIIKVAGNWLLNNIPEIAGTLADIFVNPLVGTLVQKAGRAATDWASQKFGTAHQGGQRAIK